MSFLSLKARSPTLSGPYWVHCSQLVGGSSAALNWRNDPDSASCRRGGSIPYSSDFVDPPYEQTLPLALRVADLLY